MGEEGFSTRDKVDILKHAEAMQRNELASRREEERKVFTWSSTILLAIIGALLVTRQSENIVWERYGILGRAIASIATAALVFLSTAWQSRHRRYYAQGARVILRVERLLHYFEEGFFGPNEALFPQEWAEWRKQGSELVKRCRLFCGGSFRPRPRVTRVIGYIR